MADQYNGSKGLDRQISIRWPMSFWRQVKHKCADRTITMTRLITQAVAKELGIAVPPEFRDEEIEEQVNA